MARSVEYGNIVFDPKTQIATAKVLNAVSKKFEIIPHYNNDGSPPTMDVFLLSTRRPVGATHSYQVILGAVNITTNDIGKALRIGATRINQQLVDKRRTL